MSNPVSPLNFSAVALTVLQARGGAATNGAGALVAAPETVELLQPQNEALARQSAQGLNGSIPRGQIINILV
jgi:hypothetical protein